MKTQNNYKPLKYYILIFSLTYFLWFAGAAASHIIRGSLYMILMLSGLMIPFIISLSMTFHSKDKSLVKDFINRLFNLKLINPKILPLFFLIMPASVLISITISLLFRGVC